MDAAADAVADPRGSPGQVGHDERLWPSVGIWAVAVGCAIALGLTILPVSRPGALLVAAVALALEVIVLVRTAAVVTVGHGILRAGAASIDVALLGRAEALEGTAMRAARGTDLDARAHLCIRGWLSGGVRVQLRDPKDPAPYWIISSRSPQDLAAAIEQATAAARSGGSQK